MKMHQNTKGKILIGVAAIFFAFILVVPISIYWLSSLEFLTRGFFRIIPYPVAYVEDEGFISTREFSMDVDSAKKFYQSQDFSQIGMRVDFETEEGKKRLAIKEKDVLDKLIENEIVENLAEERGIVIAPEEAAKALEEKIEREKDKKSLELNLEKLYGWSLDDFTDKVIIPQIRFQKLYAYYLEKEPDAKSGEAKISEAQKELDMKGNNFAEVAKKYSEGDSAGNGGELGWFSREQLEPSVADKVYAMKVGEISDVIKSSLGLHIIQLQEIREVQSENNAEGKIKEVKIRQIFVRQGSYLDWINKMKQEKKVFVLMRKYRWDEGIGAVTFRSDKMIEDERRIRSSSDGDPTVF